MIKSNLGRRGLISADRFPSLRETGAGTEEIVEEQCLPACILWHTQLPVVYSPYPPVHWGQDPPTSVKSRKCSTDILTGQYNRGHSSAEIPSFQVLVCVKLTEINHGREDSTAEDMSLVPTISIKLFTLLESPVPGQKSATEGTWHYIQLHPDTLTLN